MPNVSDFYLDQGTGKAYFEFDDGSNSVNDLSKSTSPKYVEVFEGVTDISQSAADYNYNTLNEIVQDLNQSGGEIVFKNGGHFRRGFLASAGIRLRGCWGR